MTYTRLGGLFFDFSMAFVGGDVDAQNLQSAKCALVAERASEPKSALDSCPWLPA